MLRSDVQKQVTSLQTLGESRFSYQSSRRIQVIDNARRKLARRHGGGLQRVDVDYVDLALPVDEDHLLAVNDALDRLASSSPVQAQVVKLRFFVGMTAAESAEVLGLSERTVKQYWSHAKTWLYREIQSKES
jgi:RNA polymerase sigma factor (TIGR02999 family)